MGSKRGDRSQHPWRPVNRGVHGYKGVATDAEADPPIVPVPVSVGVVDAEPDYLATLAGTPLELGAGGGGGGARGNRWDDHGDGDHDLAPSRCRD
jgi:hypothetical protein